MTDDEMKAFPEELGKLGFVFNFITYGGHQIDGLAAEEFATALQAGRHARAGPAAAQIPAPRVAVPDAADARRRAAARRGADGSRRAARPRPRRWARARRSTSTSSRPRCRPSCSRSGSMPGACITSGPASSRSSCGPTRPDPSCSSLRARRCGGEKLAERHLRARSGSARPPSCLDPRPEHGRLRCAEAADDAGAAVPRSTATRPARSTTSRRPRTTRHRPGT